MSMKFFDENEGWIVGRYVTMSTLTEIGGHGTYHRGKALHTTNGGKTWTTSTFTGVSNFCFSFLFNAVLPQ